MRSGGWCAADAVVQRKERGHIPWGQICQTIRLVMQRQDDVLGQLAVMLCDGGFRTGKEPKGPGHHVPHGNDNAMQQSISRRLFKNAGRVICDKILPVTESTV